MSNKRLEHELKMQSKQIEEVFARHQMQAQVTSGEVRAVKQDKQSTFDVFGKLADGLEQARALKRDLQRVLGNAQISLDREQGRLRINLFGQKAPVELLDVLNAATDLPPLTAVLGWTVDQRPLFLDLKAEDASHALIAGSGRAGKTALLRAIALSLALTNRERDLQLVIIDGRYSQVPQPYEHSGLRPFNYLPHLLTPVVTNYDTAVETLSFLVEEIQHRSQHNIKTPSIIVLIDHLVDLVEVCGTAALLPLTNIIRKGAKSGIHLILSTQRVEVAILQDIHDAYIPARIVGQVESAAQAEIAADAYDTQAEQLQGQGDFLAVVGQTMTHFQAAYINDYDLHLCLEQLHHHRPPSLVAHSFNVRPHLHVADAEASYQVDSFEAELEEIESEAEEESSASITVENSSFPTTPQPNATWAEPAYGNIYQGAVADESVEEEDEWEDEEETAENEWKTWLQQPATNQLLNESLSFEEEEEDDEYEVAVDDAHLAWLDQANSYQIETQEEEEEEEEFEEESPSSWPRPLWAQPQLSANPTPQPQPAPLTSQSDFTDNQTDEEDAWEDDIPFSWESPRFNEVLEEETTPISDLFSNSTVDEEDENPQVSSFKGEQPEIGNNYLAPVSRQTPAVQKNRFRGVRDLLSKIDETLPEKPPLPSNTTISPKQPETPAAAPEPQKSKPNGHSPQPEFRFNSIVPKVQRPKVVTSLNKPARPLPVEKQVTPQPVEEEEVPEEEAEDTVEFVDFDDGWSHTAAEEQPSTKPESSEMAEQTADELTEENSGTITTEHENGAKTIRVLNEEKPLPPTYPSPRARRYRPNTHKLQ